MEGYSAYEAFTTITQRKGSSSKLLTALVEPNL
jgi:hypothetical protein